MALSTHNTLLREHEGVIDEREKDSPKTSVALGATARKVMELDEARRTMLLAMEDTSRFPSPFGINNHDRPDMTARDDMTGLRR